MLGICADVCMRTQVMAANRQEYSGKKNIDIQPIIYIDPRRVTDVKCPTAIHIFNI